MIKLCFLPFLGVSHVCGKLYISKYYHRERKTNSLKPEEDTS